MIGIINYGMGNLASVQNALEFLGFESEIFSDPSHIKKYDKLILPGVGAFPKAMENLKNAGFVEPIKERVDSKIPFMGICLGMQLLFESSTEFGLHEGLGLLKGKVESFNDHDFDHTVPHMGWNSVDKAKESILLSQQTEEMNSYYYVHTYYCLAENRADVAGTTEYGIVFDSVVESGNIFGAQFHPEKSQKNGLQLLKNFCNQNA